MPATSLQGRPSCGPCTPFVGGQGFIDSTDFQNGFPTGPVMDFVNLNDATLDDTPGPGIAIGLALPGNGTFIATNLGNGVVVSGTIKPLPANPAPGRSVWEAASCITPLSDDPGKIEYTFAPGTGFLVQAVEPQQVDGKQVWGSRCRCNRCPERALGGGRRPARRPVAGSARVRRFALRARWPHSVVR